MARSEPEPWGGRITRYKKLPSADSPDFGNESSSSEEDLKTKIARLLENGPDTDRERGYYGTGTDGEREYTASRKRNGPGRVPLDEASVKVDTWERGEAPKSPDDWSSARSSLVWEDEEPETPADQDQTIVAVNGRVPATSTPVNGHHPAADRLPAPTVHRKTYSKPLGPLEGSSSSSSSLTPPYHTATRVEAEPRQPEVSGSTGLPSEGVIARGEDKQAITGQPGVRGLAPGEDPEGHGGPGRPEGLCNDRGHEEGEHTEMPDEVVVTRLPEERLWTVVPEERVGSDVSEDRTVEKTPLAPVWMPRSEEPTGTGSPEVREVRFSPGSPGVRGPTGSRDSEPISISNVVMDIQEVAFSAPPKDTPPPGTGQALSPLRWDTHIPSAAKEGDPLGYDIYARSIAEIVTDEMTEMPLTLGIYGGWGMGKTYLLGRMKETVDEIIDEKTKEYEDYQKGEVEGVEQNKSRGRKTKFPTAHFYILLVLFVMFLGATIACALLYDRAWVVFLVGTVVAFVLLLATVVHGFKRHVIGCCKKRCSLLQETNPMHWMVGIYLDWVDPPDMGEKPQPQRYEVIWVDFNAWEFSGCKVLWAGIVTKLCEAIEEKVGTKPARFFRVIKDQLEKRERKVMFRRAWFKLLLSSVLVLILIVTVLSLLFSAGVPDFSLFMQGQQIDAIIGSISSFLGLGLVVHLRHGFNVVKNMAKSQKDKLDAQMKKPDFAEQLGFMSEVKQEVQIVTSLLRFLEHVLKIQYRVIIVIDDLDCCAADRVVGVLEAMNILLSDEESNIISIVAMDPKIVVNCVESRLTDAIANNASGYEYLKRIIHFPVCLPEPSVADRRKLLYTVVQGKGGILVRRYKSFKTGRISFKAGTKARELLLADSQGQTSTKGRPSLWSALPDAPHDLQNQDGGHSVPLLTSSDEVDAAEKGLLEAMKMKVETTELLYNFQQSVVEDACKDYLGDVIQALDDDEDGDADNDIMPYIHGNALHMTGLYHILRMTVKVLKHRNLLQRVTPRQVASWAILVEQWPYRMSWVLQYVEDCQQKEKIRQRCHHVTQRDDSTPASDEDVKEDITSDTSLSDVFVLVKPEMGQVDKDDFRRLNNLDGDPEMFELLLSESKFRVQDMMNLLPCTVNLDYSIQRRIAAARGLALE